MSKKILITIISVIMILASANVVNAAVLKTNGQTTAVPVTYTANMTYYEVSIPASIAAADVDKQFTVNASKVNLRPDQVVTVSITSGCDNEGYVTLLRQNVPAGKKVASLKTKLMIKGKSMGTDNRTVARFEDSANSNTNLLGAVTLGALDTTELTEAGDYKGTLTFKLELKNK